MRVRIGLLGVVAFMQGHIRHHAACDKGVLHKSAEEIPLLRDGELTRQRHFDFPGRLGILALFGRIDHRPQGLAIAGPSRGVLRGEDDGLAHSSY
jgi:hypothetical protein